MPQASLTPRNRDLVAALLDGTPTGLQLPAESGLARVDADGIFIGLRAQIDDGRHTRRFGAAERHMHRIAGANCMATGQKQENQRPDHR